LSLKSADVIVMLWFTVETARTSCCILLFSSQFKKLRR